MKKAISVIAASALGAVILTAAFSGCTEANNSSSSAIKIDVPSNLVETADPKLPTFISLDDYIAQVKQQAINGSGLDDDYCTGNIYSDANGMVYEYKLREQNAGMSADQTADVIKKLLDDEEASFNSAVKSLQEVTGVKYSLRVVYLNADGSLIEERTYK